jgi:hypothetical protein
MQKTKWKVIGLSVVFACVLSLGLMSPGLVIAGQEKVTVCHKPGTQAEATLEIAAPAEAAHLAHGDYEGECHGPQSDGCTALNVLVPDPQMNTDYYLFEAQGLTFYPGETINVSMTITADPDNTDDVNASCYVLDQSSVTLASDDKSVSPGDQQSVSVSYVVVSGDNADTAGCTADPISKAFTLDSITFSCTPAGGTTR